MPDIEKLIEKCIFTPEAVTDIEDVAAIFYYFGYGCRIIGSHHVFYKRGAISLTIPTIKGRHIKRTYIRLMVKALGLEDWYERRER